MSKRSALLALLVTAVVAACYLPVLSGYLASDDFECLNAVYSGWRDPTLFFRGLVMFFRPILLLTFLLKYSLFGTNAALHLAATVLVHLINVALLFTLLSRLTKRWDIPLLTALFFGTSPLHCDAAMSAGGSSDALLALFILTTLLFAPRKGVPQPTWRWVCFFLAILAAAGAKETWIVLPCILLTFWWVVEGHNFRHAVKLSLPVFGMAVAYLAIRLMTSSSATMHAQLGYLGAGLTRCVLKASFLVTFYLGMGTSFDGHLWQISLVLLSTAAVTILLIRKRARLALWGLLWTAFTLLVTLPVPYAPSRYNYLPLIGFWILVVSGVDQLLGEVHSLARVRRALTVVALTSALVIVLPSQVIQLQAEIADYRDLGNAHRRLVEMYRAVRQELPSDRPLVVVNLAKWRPLQLLARSYRGYPKLLFVRPFAFWELIHFAPLANFAGNPFVERVRPVPESRLARAMQSDFCCLIFTDDGFVIDDRPRDALREAYRQQHKLPESVGAYEFVRADTIDE